jgi:8-oxo-dGTP pyrophosphatase MutT (NUDIX family)
MEINFQDVLIKKGKKKLGERKTVYLPFSHLCVRAIIIRRSDGNILGALHRPDGCYAPPGGALDEGESAEDALIRELEEEGISLIGDDLDWQGRLAVDYYPGHNELNLWYLFVVDGVDLSENDELLEVKWFSQNEDPWYPGNREKFIIHLRNFLPDLVQNTTL